MISIRPVAPVYCTGAANDEAAGTGIGVWLACSGPGIAPAGPTYGEPVVIGSENPVPLMRGAEAVGKLYEDEFLPPRGKEIVPVPEAWEE